MLDPWAVGDGRSLADARYLGIRPGRRTGVLVERSAAALECARMRPNRAIAAGGAMSDTVKYLLDETRIPKAWYNIVSDLPRPPDPVLHPGTLQPIGPADLEP